MLEFKSLKEMVPYFNKKTNTYVFSDDVRFRFNLYVSSDIKARDIIAYHIAARDIKANDIAALAICAFDIYANNIDAENIDACDIKARDIEAMDIKARYLTAQDIGALDIIAQTIDAEDICYNAVCIAYQRFLCRSVCGKRENALHACLDGEIEYRNEQEE